MKILKIFERDISGGAEAIKRITLKGTERVSKYALNLAKNLKRKKVTVVHKANILKKLMVYF